MEVQVGREVSVYLADRPGELAGVLEALAAAGASVTAVTVAEQHGRGLVRLLATPEDVALRVCEGLVDSGAGPVAVNDVLAVDLSGRPGVLRTIAVRLADARVNVRYAYQSPAVNGTPARAILRVDDTEAARTIIRSIV